MSRSELDALVAEATVDCYNDDEAATGLYTLMDEHLAVPFDTQLLDVPVTVKRVDLSESGQIVALCVRDKTRQWIPILDLPLPDPPPVGVEWIDAYRHWLRSGGR